MTTLRKLHDDAGAESKAIEVRLFRGNGELSKGRITRLHPGSRGITIQMDSGLGVTVTGINCSGLAGPANPNVWCLEGSWLKRYVAMGVSQASAKLDPQYAVLKELYGPLRDKVDGIEFHRVVKWGSMEVDQLAGFVSVNSKSDSEQLSGWLVKSNNITWFVLDVRAVKDVELAPFH